MGKASFCFFIHKHLQLFRFHPSNINVLIHYVVLIISCILLFANLVLLFFSVFRREKVFYFYTDDCTF